MQVVWSANVNGIDVIALEQLSPVRLNRFVSPLIGERLGLVCVACTDRFQNGLVFQIKEVVGLCVAVAVRTAHEAIADHSNIESFH